MMSGRRTRRSSVERIHSSSAGSDPNARSFPTRPTHHPDSVPLGGALPVHEDATLGETPALDEHAVMERHRLGIDAEELDHLVVGRKDGEGHGHVGARRGEGVAVEARLTHEHAPPLRPEREACPPDLDGHPLLELGRLQDLRDRPQEPLGLRGESRVTAKDERRLAALSLEFPHRARLTPNRATRLSFAPRGRLCFVAGCRARKSAGRHPSSRRLRT